METGYKPRIRPISELTLFKGRQKRSQWERMPEPVPSPAMDISLQAFDFQLPKEGNIVTHATDITAEGSSGDALRRGTYDCR